MRGWILAPSRRLAQSLCHESEGQRQISLDAFQRADRADSEIVLWLALTPTTIANQTRSTSVSALPTIASSIVAQATTTRSRNVRGIRRCMTHQSVTHLSDQDLLAATVRAADACRRQTAELIALLAEVESRQLYRGLGHSSLFTYCTEALRLSEPAAYTRITAARAALRRPVILQMLAEGDITLTTITLIASHLTDENHEALLAAARHKSKRDVEHLVASIGPRPDVASSVRKLPTPKIEAPAAPSVLEMSAPSTSVEPELLLARPAARAIVAPLAPERYLVKITISRETHSKLERARDLLRHSIPNGDPAAIVDRALTVLVEQLERSKEANARRPRTTARAVSRGRHVPAAVKRAVVTRDERRCAFVGANGRCTETGFLEFHHLVPFAMVSTSEVRSLALGRAPRMPDRARRSAGGLVADRRSRHPRSTSRVPSTPRTSSGRRGSRSARAGTDLRCSASVR